MSRFGCADPQEPFIYRVYQPLLSAQKCSFNESPPEPPPFLDWCSRKTSNHPESENWLKMSLTIGDSGQQCPPQPFPIDPNFLYHAFEHVKDGRKRRGKRSPLALIFTLLLLGKLAGETTIHGALEWVNLRAHLLKKQLNWPRRFPSNATVSRALARCDAEQLAQVVAAVLLKARAEEKGSQESATPSFKQVAMDGKTVRGTLGHRHDHHPAVHVVSWYEPESGLVLAHRAVEDKQNEISPLPGWLSPTLVKDRIVTADALHTQRAFCADIIRFGGHSVLIVKKNHPTLWQDIHPFFTDPQAEANEWKPGHLWNKGHGRLEERRIWTTTLLNPLFGRQWAGVAQVFVIRRRITHPLKCTQQIVYGITSLTPQQAGPDRLLELEQTHWHIENRSHHRRDVTMGEDASQLRTSGACCSQWNSARPDGLASRFQYGFSDARLLRQTPGCLGSLAWGLTMVVRDFEKALYGLRKALIVDELRMQPMRLTLASSRNKCVKVYSQLRRNKPREMLSAKMYLMNAPTT